MQQKNQGGIIVFFSYAQADQKVRDQLAAHLSQLKRDGLIEEWSDQQIPAGANRAQEIDEAIRRSRIILLLISADFLASDTCYHVEMQHALERHRRGEARVIPVIVRPCDWQHSPFAHLQCLPPNTKPISTWNDRDEAFVTIVQELRKVVALQHFPPPLLTDNQRQNRTRLLKRVRTIWIKGLLEQSLHRAAWIDLHLQEQPDALGNPWRFQVQELDQTPRALPVDTGIVEIYDEADGELLLLGEPGSGKTTLLLHLAHTLLDRAEADERYQVPVIFNLSSWAQNQESIATWLVEELKTKYQMPRQVGQHWIEANQVLPLLDGLDEVAKEARVACIQAITAYYHRLNQAGTPLVICCRSAEYQSLSLHLPLQRAVSILPLTDEQIEGYLSNVEGQLEGLRQTLRNDADLYVLARRPLMLSIFTLAYQGEAVIDFPTHEQVLHTVFASYVKHMLSRRGLLPSWMQERFLPWIIYVAKQLHQRQQTVFSVEDLQPDWLPGKQQHLYWWSLWLLVGLGLGLLATLLVGLGLGQFGRPPDVISSVMGSGLGNSKQLETRGVSRRRVVFTLLGMFSLLVAVLSAMLGGGLGAVLFVGLTASLIAVGITSLLRMRAKEVSLFPNEGIWRSMRSGLVGGLFGVLGFGLFGVLGFGLAGGLLFGLVGGLCIGLGCGLLVCIQHCILRFWLWRMNYLPWKLVPFLDEAAERLFLRKVGGSYIFVHRLLLEYFAILDESASTESTSLKEKV